MNWTSRPQLISFIRDHRSTLPHSYALRTARPGLTPDSFCLTKATTDPQFAGHATEDSEQVNMAFESGSHKQLNAIPNPPGGGGGSGGRVSPSFRPDSFSHLPRHMQHHQQHPMQQSQLQQHRQLQFAAPPRRSDSLPSPSAQPSAGVVITGDDPDGFHLGSAASAAPLADGYDQVVFQFTKVPAEDFAREITLMFLPVFTAIQPDELTSVAWHGREKESRAPNVVKFTRVFNHINFWVQKCLLETTGLSNRASVLAHFVKIAKRLFNLQNLHGTFAVVAALQSQPIFRLKKTWAALARKHVETFERLADVFSADNNHERLRKLMHDIRQPVIPYLGLYMNDLVYIDTCHPSTGGLETQARKDKMNNICRVLSDYQQSQYNFQSKEHVRRYLDGQTYIEEMQSFVEAANYKTSKELEPHSEGGSASSGAPVAVPVQHHESLRVPAASDLGAEGPLGARSRLDSQGSAAAVAAAAAAAVAADCRGAAGGGGHRKSKSFSDASVICSGTPSQPVSIHRHQTIGPNSVEIQRNLIDDSPAFASACAVSPDSASYCTPGDRSLTVLNASQSPNVSTTPLMTGVGSVSGVGGIGGGGGHSLPRFLPHSATGPAPNRQLEEALSLAPVICHGVLQRKAVYKSGKKQTRSRYSRFWAELVITENGSHPLIRLFEPSKPFANDRRDDFKRQCKKQQDLTDASVVVFENTSQCGDPEHTFQINFDLSDHSAYRQNPSDVGKFCSYKYRASGGRGSRDRWVAQIKRAIQQTKKEKALIDFEEAPEPQPQLLHQRLQQQQLGPVTPRDLKRAANNLNNNRSENSLDVIEESTQL